MAKINKMGDFAKTISKESVLKSPVIDFLRPR